MRFRSLKFKIILSSAVCILVVGVFSNTFLYCYLTGIITEKSDHIDILNLENVQRQLNRSLDSMLALGDNCANDVDVARAMRHRGLDTLAQKRDALRAQEILRAYRAASNIDKYINSLMAFNVDENGEGFAVQAVSNVNITPVDPQRVRELDLFHELEESERRWVAAVSVSIEDGRDCVAYLSPIYSVFTSTFQGWLYIELNTDWVTEFIASHSPGSMFVSVNGQRAFPEDGVSGLPESLFPLAALHGWEERQGDRVYKIHSVALRLDELRLYSRTDVTFLVQDGSPILFTVLVWGAMSLTVALVMTFVLSSVITRPLKRLSARIQKITANDFSYDPDIERGGDEIAEAGRTVNEMSGSIRHLLTETEEMHVRRKNAEIALLQSQVNPHFLHNTLDSIHWMATIQKNTGIMKVTRSLSSLLKNLAKGVGDKIPLLEELRLLDDYAAIQSVRYMETFRLVKNIDERFHKLLIVKFTLQPLVENAIFHGIEPTGNNGTITLTAREDGGDLLLIVEDDGVGMTEGEIGALMASNRNPLRTGLSGIGVSNVDSRLKLVYGRDYGLTYESEKGRYTRVTVRIPREPEDAAGQPLVGGE